MRAKLSFSQPEIDDLIREKAAQGGFIATSDIMRDGDELFIEVRPMTPEEKAAHDIQAQPVEVRMLSQLQTVVEKAIQVLLQEHENTRDFTDNSIMEWLEPFRTSVNRIEEAVQNLRQNDRFVAPNGAAGKEDEDEFAEARRQRFERVRKEQEEEADIERTTLKGESTEFPEDMRVT